MEVENAVAEVELAEKQVKLLEQSVEQANELLVIDFLQYKEGEIDFLTYLENMRAASAVKVRYSEALFAYNQKLALLEKAVGTELRREKEE